MQTTGAKAVPDGATGRGLLSRRPPRGPSHGRAPRLRPGVGVERPSGVPSILLATGRGRTLSLVRGYRSGVLAVATRTGDCRCGRRGWKVQEIV